MKLSTRARYALRLMLDIARKSEDGTPVSLGNVAKRTGLSRGYLEQLAVSLRNAQLLRGVCGKGGGYRLARDASEITLRQITEAAIGPINIVDCLDDPSECLRSPFCECRPVYWMINAGVAEVLDRFSLADLRDPAWVKAMTLAVQEQESAKDRAGSRVFRLPTRNDSH